jgi:hypothetical protein
MSARGGARLHLQESAVAKWILLVADVEAAATGVVLIVSPSLFARLILGTELSDSGEALGRIAGIAMLGAGLAAWPAPAAASAPASAIRALLIYNVLATIYLGYLGLGGRLAGILLWPAVALHVVLSVLLGRALLGRRRPEPADVASGRGNRN